MELFVAQYPGVAVGFMYVLCIGIIALLVYGFKVLVQRFDTQDTLLRTHSTDMVAVKARIGSLEHHAWGKAPEGR